MSGPAPAVRPRALVIEDEPSIVTSLEFLLGRAGFEVIVSADGEEAMALAARLQPRLVVLDVMLPGMDGLEVCRRLRADPALGTARILMLTARGGAVDVEKGIAAGADLYMTKPFATRDFIAAVERLAGPAGERVSD